jgi:hypothetical protein
LEYRIHIIAGHDTIAGMKAIKDIIITCESCGQQFPFTIGEQEFFVQKHLAPPTRCMICRAMVKEAADDQFRGKMGKVRE